METTNSTLILLVCLFLSFNLSGQDAPSKAPEQIFTLSPDNLGQASNSVNLFTGEVNFPVNLASVPGRNGLSANVSMQYSSAGVTQQASIWNNDAPTGIVGLGWSIDQPRIVVDNKSTGTNYDDEYYLISGGSSNKLVWVREDLSSKEYAVDNFQFWKIHYFSVDDRWEIIDENGVKYIYGNKNSGKNTIQWVVKWGNWIGSSSVTSNQSQQALVYNLWKVVDRVGAEVEYEYNNIDQYVGGTLGKSHTEASYLTKISTSTGESIVLNYSTKGLNEFVEPHTEQPEPDAYQERYEQLYLSSVDAYNYQGLKLSTTSLLYKIIGAGNLTKRIIEKVNYIDRYGKTSNGYSFQYNTSATLNGKLSSIETSNGGVISYSYSSTALQPAKSKRDLTINARSGYAEPEINYGPDYVLVTWRQLNSDGTHYDGNRPVEVYMYTWEGYWKEQYLTTIYDVQLLDGFRKAYSTVTGKDFFAISAWDPSTSYSYRVYLYSKDKTTGQWLISVPDGYYETSEQLGQPKLLAGDNYVALHTYRDGDIITYVRKGNIWERKVIGQFGNEWHATGTNNWIFSHQKGGDDYLIFHYLKENRTWTTKSVPSAFNSVHDKTSYWHASNSFALALPPNNNEYIFSWDENYNNFVSHNVMGDFPARSNVLIQNNSLISINQEKTSTVIEDGFTKVYYYFDSKLARFDSSSFQTHGTITGWGVGGVAIGDDYVTYQSDPRFNTDDWIYVDLDSYNPNILSWSNSLRSAYNEGQNTYAAENSFPLEPGIQSAFLLDNFYYKEPSGSFTFKGDIVLPSTETIRSLSVAYPLNYLIYSIMNSSTKTPIGHKVHLMKNGILGTAISGNGYVSSMNNMRSATYSWELYQPLYSGSTYITTEEWNGIENATTLTLHRVINEDVSGLQSHYPVVSITVNDGIDTNHTSFEYDPVSARFDPSGITAQYEKVTTIPGTSDPSIKPFGYTETFFYNKPTSTSKGNLLIGTPYQSRTFDKDGVQVANSSTSFTLLSTTINAIDFYYVRPSSASNNIDGITTSVTHTYKRGSGLISTSETTNYNSQGAAETLKKEFTYGYEVYPELKDENLLSAVVQQRSFNSSTVTSSTATKWTAQSGKLLPKESYTWKGTSASYFTYWTTTPSSDWLKTSEITGRDAAFNVTGTRDIDDIFTTTVFGHNNRIPIGSFYNASSSEVLVENFNEGALPPDWLVLGGGFTVDNNMLKASNETGESLFFTEWDSLTDNYIAEFRVKFDRDIPSTTSDSSGIGFHFAKDWSTDYPHTSGLLFKINPYTGNYTLSSPADSILATVLMTDNFDWHNYRIVKKDSVIKVYLDGRRIIEATSNLMMKNFLSFYVNQAFGYIDDFRIYPDDASAVTTSYDPKYLIAESLINEDGLYTQTLLDETTPVARINTKGLVASTFMGYSPKHDGSAIDSTNLLLNHQTSPMGTKGFVEDFLFDDEWSTVERSNGSSSVWTSDNGKLFHQNSGNATDSTTDMYHITLPEPVTGKVGVEFTFRSNAFPDDHGFGIAVAGDAFNFTNGGSELAAWMDLQVNDLGAHNGLAWNYFKNDLKLNTNYRIKVLLDIATQSADYFVDGKLLLQDYPFRSASDDISKIAFFNYGYGTAASSFYIDNLIVYSDPIQSTVFADAAGKERQSLVQEDDNNVIVTETIYNALGREDIQTKSTRVPGELTFKDNFVTSYNTSTGEIIGDVDTINGDGYAGVKGRFEDSPLGRLVEQSIPGADYLIGSGNNSIREYLNNSTAGLDMGSQYPQGKYFVNKINNPDGGTIYKMRDLSGKTVVEKAGEVEGKEKQLVHSTKTIYEYDTFNFTSPANHIVDYDYQTTSGSGYIFKIGTSPGASDILYAGYPVIGSFEAAEGVIYYFEIAFDQLQQSTTSSLPSSATITYAGEEQLFLAFIHLTTSYEYDVYGNVVKVYPPNYHNPQDDTIDPELYITTNTYDFFGRLKTSATPDSDTTRYMYNEKTGRLRFMQDGNGDADEDIDENILYTKYDGFGRIIETGFNNSPWDEFYLQSDANMSPDWPAPPTWRKRFTYGTHGLLTSEKDNILKIEINNDADGIADVVETYAYNETGELISKGIEMPGTSYNHTIRYTYDNAGNIIEEDYAEGPGKVAYGYDNAGRLKTIGKVSDPDIYASYEYDINGALSQEKTNNGTLIKTLSYDISGRMTQTDDSYFNEILSYTTGGYNNSGYHGGPIARTTFDYKNISLLGGHNDNYYYSYQYDKLGQLQVADNSVNSAWSIGTASPNSLTTYDANGNILSIEKGGTTKTYTYDDGTNKINRTTGSIRQYYYDDNGNITQSTPLNLTFTYDPFFNKTMSVKHATGSTSFLYQGDGERVYKNITEGTSWYKTFYIRGLGDYPLVEKYEDNTGNIEARYYIYGAGGIVAMMHSYEATLSSSATMEEGSFAEERKQFGIDMGYGHRINAKLFNHTPGDSSRYSLRLSGSHGEEQGLIFTTKVRKGDTVRMEVFAKYVKDVQDPDADALIMALASMATGAVSPGAGEGLAAKTSGTDPGQDLLLPGEKNNDGNPKAYLNYMLYDTLFNLLDAGYIPVTEAAAESGSNSDHEQLVLEKISGHDGYMQAFVSNESEETTDVYFDDMTMSVSSTNQLYFMSTDHLGSTRVLVRDDNTVMARYDYNPWGEVIRSEITEDIAYQYTGQEKDKELGLWNFRARFYDPELGRFYGVDPQGQFASPYAGMGNNPVIYVDPDGEFMFLAAAAAAYFVFFTETGYDVQKYISPVAVNFDVNLGSHQRGIGVNASVGIPQAMPISYRVHGGATYYWKNYDITPGWETRYGAEWGTPFLTVGGTHYNSPGDKFDQTLGHLRLGVPGLNIKYENDWFWDLNIPGVPNADGGDRYRTAAAKVQLGPLHVGINFFTGDPGLDPDDRVTRVIDGHETYILNRNGDDPDEYRAGVGYIGIGPFRFGNDRERRRHRIQNQFVHNNITGSPYFRFLNRRNRWFFQFGGGGGSLW